MTTSFTPEAKQDRIEAKIDANIANFVATQTGSKTIIDYRLCDQINSIHATNIKGVAKTDNYPAVMNFHALDNNGIRLTYKGAICEFLNLEHLLAYCSQALNARLNSTDYSALLKQFEHITNGTEQGKTFISLTHGDTTMPADKFAKFKDLFESLSVTKVESNGKGSKLYKLFIEQPNNSHLSTLVDNGFTNITPLLEGLSVVGLKVELPKVGD
jgi:hypothetical protein